MEGNYVAIGVETTYVCRKWNSFHFVRNEENPHSTDSDTWWNLLNRSFTVLYSYL
jgi:hypothetical protein